MRKSFSEAANKIEKINILDISRLNLARFLRDELGLGITDSLLVAKLIQHAHQQGVIRGQCLKP